MKCWNMSEPSALATVDVEQGDLEGLRPTLARIARVTKALFSAPAAEVTIFMGDEIWRASDLTGQISWSDPASELTMRGGEVLWVGDLAADSRFADHPTVVHDPHLRFYAGAPIQLETGDRIGALAVFDIAPRDHDDFLAERLHDLASVVAHEFDRMRVVRDCALALERTERSEQRLQLAVQLADLHVYEMDYVNRTLLKVGAEDTFFETPKTYADMWKNVWGQLHPDDVETAKAAWERHVKEGVPFQAEYRIERTDGKEIWAYSTSELFEDEHGRPLRLVGALQNITSRKQAEAELVQARDEAESANRAKSAFLATMSHEIRTPLNGVLGMAQAMAVDDLSPVQRERLDVVRQSGESLLAILNDILDLSKIEAGKLELEEINFDLAEIARGAHSTFTGLANKKGLSFALDTHRANGVYRGDPTRVRQILYNLISNALKFTELGEIRVVIAYAEERLRIVVSDTGVGMSAQTVASLFNKFTQADSTTTRRFGGTGLGLAICRELAELMGGFIEATSQLGDGSSFTVILPLPRVGAARAPAGSQAARAPAADRAADAADPADSAPLRVLAAEDNSVNQLVLKTLLHQVGMEPIIVDNGLEAVTAWEVGEWDLILMDIQMPQMDGPTAARKIREGEAAWGRPRTPIIALTANAMAHQVAEYLAAGMDAVVTKPIEAAKLFETLQAVLSEEPAAAVA
jgi:signal transduction histidine kinase